jgi:hypothetical protein
MMAILGIAHVTKKTKRMQITKALLPQNNEKFRELG